MTAAFAAQEQSPPASAIRKPFVALPFLALILCIFVGNMFATWYVSSEHIIYSSERTNFWLKTLQMLAGLQTDPVGTVHEFIRTIREEDYNNLATIFLLPFAAIFGGSRLVFVLSIVNSYLLLGFITIFLLTKKTLQNVYWSKLAAVCVAINIMTFPVAWQSVLRGYPDVGGGIVIGLILMTYLRQRVDQQNWKTAVTIGCGLAMLFLFRRWYANFCVGYFIAATIDMLISAFLSKTLVDARKVLMNGIIALSVSGVTLTAIVLFIAAPLVFKIADTNYDDVYSFVNYTESNLVEIETIIRRIGIVQITLAMLGALGLFLLPDKRRICVFLVLLLVSCTALFLRIQSFDDHHLLLLSPIVLVFSSSALVLCLDRIQGGLPRLIMGTFFSFTFIAILALAYFPALKKVNALLPFPLTETNYATSRNDIPELIRLHETLRSLSLNGERIYVLSHSKYLSARHLQTIFLTLNQPENPFYDQYVTASTLDKRDGFPKQFFKSTYVVVTQPVQTVYKASEQRVITELSASIINKNNIGRSYTKLDYEFQLDNNIRAYIYMRTQPFAKKDIDELQQIFKTYYPTRPELFTFDIPKILLLPE